MCWAIFVQAMEVVDLDQQTKMDVDLDAHVMCSISDENANRTMQKCTEYTLRLLGMWCAFYVIKMETTIYRNALRTSRRMPSSSAFQPYMAKFWCYRFIHMDVEWYMYACSGILRYTRLTIFTWYRGCQSTLWRSYNLANNDGWGLPDCLLVCLLVETSMITTLSRLVTNKFGKILFIYYFYWWSLFNGLSPSLWVPVFGTNYWN